MWSKSRGDGFHITKVGLWFLVFLLIVIVSATNTGNNGLFLVLAAMAAALVVSEVLGRLNVVGLDVRLTSRTEVFANSPSHLGVEVANPSRWRPRWLLVTSVAPEDVEPALGRPPRRRKRRGIRPFLVPHLPRRSLSRGQIELMVRRRGRLRLRYLHVGSLFPLGLFRKGRRYRSELEVLVYPEIFSTGGSRPAQLGKSGDEPTRRPGWGHEILGLRAFRHGDDPRGIHWKQTARTGDLIFKERETEENRRLLIVFDNAVGKLASSAARARFERLVSEAATAALDYLESGYEVGLTTREGTLAFASGSRQRLAILETLALIEPRSRSAEQLASDATGAPHLRLAMEPAPVQGRRPAERVVA